MKKNRIISLVGKIFGEITILSFSHKVFSGKQTRKYYWVGKCSCGKEKIFESGHLKTGRVKSCGCLRRKLFLQSHLKPNGGSASNAIYHKYKESASIRGHSFSLTFSDFLTITSNNCYFCKKIPSNIRKQGRYSYTYNGIDRVDNNIGYIVENCITCCKDCNIKKSSIDSDMVFKLYEWFKNKGYYDSA